MMMMMEEKVHDYSEREKKNGFDELNIRNENEGKIMRFKSNK